MYGTRYRGMFDSTAINWKDILPYRLRAATRMACIRFENPPLDKEFNWNKYALVIAGKTRKLILREMFFLKAYYENGISLAVIRKKLSRIYPITLSQTYSAMSYLLKARIVRVAGYAKLRNSKLYKLTPSGIRICEYMLGQTPEFPKVP